MIPAVAGGCTLPGFTFGLDEIPFPVIYFLTSWQSELCNSILWTSVQFA
jgi:hypothetical protein